VERVGTAYLGILLWVASVVIYAGKGFSTAVGLLCLLGLVLGGAALYEPIELPARIDLIVPPLLMLAFAPLYLVRIASLPVQVNSDEVAIMYYAKQYASAAHPDLFGLSAYSVTRWPSSWSGEAREPARARDARSHAAPPRAHEAAHDRALVRALPPSALGSLGRRRVRRSGAEPRVPDD